MHQASAYSDACAEAVTAGPLGLGRRLFGRRQGGVDLAFEARLGLEPDHSLDRLAVLEEDERGNAHDAKLSGDDRGSVDVEFADFDLASVLLVDLLNDGGDHATGGAPFGPKVD